MLEKSEEFLTEIQPDGTRYLDAVIGLCLAIRENGMKRVNNNAAIGKLRVMFSKISLDKLEPDLVIMDEFQRFKYLINSDPESETGMLANKFFSSNNVRMLLLSATPYKMYSTLEEIDDSQVDEHYSEFLDVMSFLNIGQHCHQNPHICRLYRYYNCPGHGLLWEWRGILRNRSLCSTGFPGLPGSRAQPAAASNPQRYAGGAAQWVLAAADSLPRSAAWRSIRGSAKKT